MKWECELKWGDCGKCGWGSCIHAKFASTAVCTKSMDFGAGVGGGAGKGGASPSVGLSFSMGMTKLGDVVTGIFGQPNCNP